MKVNLTKDQVKSLKFVFDSFQNLMNNETYRNIRNIEYKLWKAEEKWAFKKQHKRVNYNDKRFKENRIETKK